MDRNYLSVRLTVWHLKAAIDEIRPITIDNGELSICTEEGAAVQRHPPPLCEKRCGAPNFDFFCITSRTPVCQSLDLRLTPPRGADTLGLEPLE